MLLAEGVSAKNMQEVPAAQSLLIDCEGRGTFEGTLAAKPRCEPQKPAAQAPKWRAGGSDRRADPRWQGRAGPPGRPPRRGPPPGAVLHAVGQKETAPAEGELRTLSCLYAGAARGRRHGLITRQAVDRSPVILCAALALVRPGFVRGPPLRGNGPF